MSLRINTNTAAMRIRANLSQVERDSHTCRARLASGLRVMSGRDSGAKLAVSEAMRATISGLTRGNRNAEHATDLLRIADGAMNEISAVLIRMRTLAVQASSDTFKADDREAMDAEFNQLKSMIDRTARTTRYNDMNLLSGFGNQVDKSASTAIANRATTGLKRISLSGADKGTYRFVDEAGDDTLTLGNGVVTQTLDFSVGTMDGGIPAGTTAVLNFDRLGIRIELAGQGRLADGGAYVDGDLHDHTLVVVAGTGGSFQLGSEAARADRLEYDIRDLTVDGPVLNIAQASVGTRDGARLALARIDAAIQGVALERGAVGAVVNRLSHTMEFTTGAMQRIQASESTIRDADLAVESTRLARNEILKQSNTAVLLQSRIPIDMALSLLQ